MAEAPVVVDLKSDTLSVTTAGDTIAVSDCPEQVIFDEKTNSVEVVTKNENVQLGVEVVEILIDDASTTVQIEGTGPQGPIGATGGTPQEFCFTAQDNWVAAHNLGRKPASVEVYVGGCLVDASVLNLDLNVLQVCFKSPQTGCVVVT